MSAKQIQITDTMKPPQKANRYQTKMHHLFIFNVPQLLCVITTSMNSKYGEITIIQKQIMMISLNYAPLVIIKHSNKIPVTN